LFGSQSVVPQKTRPFQAPPPPPSPSQQRPPQNTTIPCKTRGQQGAAPYLVDQTVRFVPKK